MLHFVSFHRRNGGKLMYFSFFIITALLLSSVSASGDEKKEQGSTNIINKVLSKVNGNDLELRIKGSTVPTYTIYELFKPSRIVVDIANAEVKEAQKLTLPSNLGISIATKSIHDVTPNLTRFEFTLPQSFSFNTNLNGNDIIITLVGFNNNEQTVVQNTTSTTSDEIKKPTKRIKHNKSIESQLPKIDPIQAATNKAGNAGKATAGSTMQDSFNFSGYNKERITVDFYKIDLHNVFRLLREVSGVNIVVDQSVTGSLTLALNDVPWDFALDIILNLKDLQKEERYNTIVIHPKKKTFNWPERAEDNLSFEADDEMIEQESLIIQQQEIIPQSQIDAKKLIAKGRKAAKRGNFESAVQIYEEAFKKWPQNGKLANKIAGIYLVQLRQNSKALYFADKALAVDNKNTSAALNAAIANANMHEDSLAQQYFDQSVNVGKPSSAALQSYAAFSEKLNHYDAAIKLLLKHDEIYGQNLNSMVARARILDKKGEHESSTEAYRAILLSGFRVPPDLKKFITGRMSLSKSL